MYWRIGSRYQRRPGPENRKDFLSIVRRGPAPGLLAFEGEPRGRLVPGDAAWRPRIPRASAPAAAAPCRTGVVGLVLLHPPRLPAARRQRGAARRGGRARSHGRGAGAGGLPVRRGARRDAAARLHGRRLDVHAGGIWTGRRGEPGPADHATHVPEAVRSRPRSTPARWAPRALDADRPRGPRRRRRDGAPPALPDRRGGHPTVLVEARRRRSPTHWTHADAGERSLLPDAADSTPAANPAHGPSAHRRSLAGAGRPLRPARSLERLLVHVLAHRGRLPRPTEGGESRRPALRRPPRTPSRPPRLRRRRGGGLVPGDPAPRAPLPGWVHEIRTARRPTGLVGVVLLRPARIPRTGRLLGAARSGHPLRAGGGCARARGLPVDEGPEVVHRPRVHVRARGLPGGRGPKRGSAGHATGASTRGSAASGRARDETNIALSRRCPARRPTCCTA